MCSPENEYYNELALELKTLYKSLIKVGFSEEAAVRVLPGAVDICVNRVNMDYLIRQVRKTNGYNKN